MRKNTFAWISSLALAVSCASQPKFYESRLVASQYDEQSAATRVTVSFEIWDADGLPINDVEEAELRVWEDGVLATSESSFDLQRTRHPIDVVLLLDRSESMRQREGGPNVRDTAQRIVDGLGDHPVNLHLYSFANTVEPLGSVVELTNYSGGDSRSRWTALYYAITTVLDERGLLHRSESTRSRPDQAPYSPQTVLVVCTDGADNYSHNHDLMTLVDLEKRVRENGVVIHAVGLGGIADEQDRQGVNGREALRRLAVNGSFRTAGDAESIEDLVERVARYVRATYQCVFVSPSFTGEHELVLEVDRGGRRGRSTPIRFPTHRPQAEPGR